MNQLAWVFEQGDWVSYALALVSTFLWTALLLRALFLRGCNPSTGKTHLGRRSILAGFAREARRLQDAPKRLENLAARTRSDLDILRGPIKTLVAVAPLLGLLGTVIGMVEMFGSMEGSMGRTGETTVAGGISTALVTTQLGLVIAVPGLFASYMLSRQQLRRERDIDEILRSLGRSAS